MQIYASNLLEWYDKFQRTLPWRLTPEEQKRGIKPDPYRIWLSEIMLQQTTVETVKPYFMHFINKWPDIESLARASMDDILRAWAGLGYYSRARNLKLCSEKIVCQHNSRFPADIKKLRSLPGIGDYTAAAVTAIAFDLSHAVIDGNVERIISRLFAIKTVFPKAKKEIRLYTQKITPLFRPGDFAQAMMDLGSLICTVKRPNCVACPINKQCIARRENIPEFFPVKPPKTKKQLRTGIAFVALSRNRRIYLKKRPKKGLLAGMSEIPNHFSPETDKTDLSSAPFRSTWIYQSDIRHTFTHFILSMSVYLAQNLPEKKEENGWWVNLTDLDQEALPTVFKKAIEKAIPGTFPNRIINR